MSNLSERQYEKGLSLHNTERYIPHMSLSIRNGYLYLAVTLYTYLFNYLL